MKTKKYKKNDLINKINNSNLSDQDKADVIEFIIATGNSKDDLLYRSMTLVRVAEFIKDIFDNLGDDS